MSGGLQQLLFTVGLIDRVSGPAGRMMNNINQATTNIRNGYINVIAGADSLAALGRTVKSVTNEAISFESAMANVNKVVDFTTPTGLKDFGNDLLVMSRTIPISAKGLAEIAAAGGEQGIQLLDLPGFVETVAKMSTAFDIGTSEAGDSIGKLANIYHVPVAKIGELGDAINFISNNSTAKARDILDVLNRVGGIAGQFGITTNQTAALSAAMLSLGQASDVSGTAINAMLGKLNTARSQSKGFQEGLAAIGLSSSQLEKNIRQGPQQAIDDFLNRIAALDKHSQALVLGDLFGNEYADNLAILVGGLDTYKKTLGFVSDATKFQGSMQGEFNIKAGTTENHLQLLKNHWDNVLVSGGTIFLPKIVEWVGVFNTRLGIAADSVTRWYSLFPNLSSAIVGTVVAVVALLAAMAGLAMSVGIFTMIGGGFTLLWTGVTAVWGWVSAVWAFNAALFANPLTWWIVGIIAVSALVAAAIVYWDEWTQAVINWAAAFLEWTGIFGVVDSVLAFLNKIPEWWGMFMAFMGGLHPFDVLVAMVDAFVIGAFAKFDQLRAFLSHFLDGINPFAGVGAGIDAIVGRINSATGLSLPTMGASSLNTAPKVKAGGISQQISSIMYANKSSSVGNVSVHNYGQSMSGARLRQELLLSAP